MCKPASFIVTQGRVLWDIISDSHEEIISKNGLVDGSETSFVRVEITPENNDYRIPIDQWKFNIDQDIIPDWFSTQDAEIAARSELPRWAAVHIILEGEHEISGNASRIVLDGILRVTNQTDGDCWFYGSSQGIVTNQTGGNCGFDGSSQGTVTNQTGGNCRFYGSSKKLVSK